MLAFPPHPFAFFLIPGYVLRTLDNSNFFYFPRRLSYRESTAYCHCFVPLDKILGPSTSNTSPELIICASSLCCLLLERTFSHLFFVPPRFYKEYIYIPTFQIIYPSKWVLGTIPFRKIILQLACISYINTYPAAVHYNRILVKCRPFSPLGGDV